MGAAVALDPGSTTRTQPNAPERAGTHSNAAERTRTLPQWSLVQPVTIATVLIVLSTAVWSRSSSTISTLANHPNGPSHPAPGAAGPAHQAPPPGPQSERAGPQPGSGDTRRCPPWFRFIASDLAPWRESGVTEADVDAAMANVPGTRFRLQVVGGQLYTNFDREMYSSGITERGLFTLWGFLMLLRHYGDAVPDVDLVFYLGDLAPEEGSPPPLLGRFCASSQETALGMLWPDWTFWGWPQLRIASWSQTCPALAAAGGPWQQRLPRAFWKGNPRTGRRGNHKLRRSLFACDQAAADPPHPYGVELEGVTWDRVHASGNYSDTRLDSHCKYRYLIYVEGNTWSVSLKYALCCGSTVLSVYPKYHDFFSRALQHKLNIVSIPRKGICDNLKSAVDAGNNGTMAAEQIADAGAAFAGKDLAMHNVYEYMLHSLQAYARLLKFAPRRSETFSTVSKEWLLEALGTNETERYLVADEIQYKTPCVL